ncbi:IspD/TarI family cytidylyltransferase [Mucisphaera calidilacus]|uniref:2-C-methyl-D-erythritol 4-phosphate cytidylyltransferase n=1 Tax=Mucisphaera calidilacus TaxID=2527982 RepID=A0A518BY73_9BACT|nr:2-C-methyl-D-erythritol 4-phosphate cytidylyltransferase [Mucisphaera calidilacus]QDU71908.1 2-C-methyl-D-erythritol 4-phosphate cytidylyltransferase [Mucisphaera calidilacus]
MRLALILLAAGRGSRFGLSGGRTKVELLLGGRPVFLHALDRFAGVAGMTQRLLVVSPDDQAGFESRWADELRAADARVVAGGLRDRWESVWLALGALEEDVTHVAIHDAARPCTDPASIERVVAGLADYGAVIPALCVSSTLKRSTGDPPGEIHGTVDRSGLVEVQTPQAFERGLLEAAFLEVIEDLRSGHAHVTDDASLIERRGGRVLGVEGDAGNIKITRPGDEVLAEAILRHRYPA